VTVDPALLQFLLYAKRLPVKMDVKHETIFFEAV
jgi:hypothetical protein